MLFSSSSSCDTREARGLAHYSRSMHGGHQHAVKVILTSTSIYSLYVRGGVRASFFSPKDDTRNLGGVMKNLPKCLHSGPFARTCTLESEFISGVVSGEASKSVRFLWQTELRSKGICCYYIPWRIVYLSYLESNNISKQGTHLVPSLQLMS